MVERWTGGSELAEANFYIEWINRKVLLYNTGDYSISFHKP